MESRRQITEDDLVVTEAMIARSYSRLKRSLAQAPSRALGSVGGTMRKHPLGTASAAIAAGVALYGLFRLMTRRGPVRERGAERGERRRGSDLGMDLLSMILPLATPYFAGYLERYLGRIFSGDRS